MVDKKHEEYLIDEMDFDVTNFVKLSTKTVGAKSITLYQDSVTSEKYYVCHDGTYTAGHFNENEIPDGFEIGLPPNVNLPVTNENVIYTTTDPIGSDDILEVNFTVNGEWGDLQCPFIVEVWFGVSDIPIYFNEVAENMLVHIGNLTMKEIKDKFTAVGLTFEGYRER